MDERITAITQGTTIGADDARNAIDALLDAGLYVGRLEYVRHVEVDGSWDPVFRKVEEG